MHQVSREERETLYRHKMTELQTRWGNPFPDDWAFVKNFNDRELDEELKGTISQLRFEKGLAVVGWTLALVVSAFVAAGLVGLLVFGIKQL